MPRNGKKKVKSFFSKLGGNIKSGVNKAIEAERKYVADAPIRRSKKIARLKQERQILSQKAAIAKQKTSIVREKQKVFKLRQQSGGFGFGSGDILGGSDIFGLGSPPPRRRRSSSRKKPRKKKSSKKSRSITINF